MIELEEVPGVGPAAAKKLKGVFITTAELLAVQNPNELQSRTKLGEGTCKKLVRAARDLVGGFGIMSGIEVEQEMAAKIRLLFGLEDLDESMLGGIEEGSLVELYGPARGGKTQWCYHLAVRAQLPVERGGLDGRVIWLDTESSFKPLTFRACALRWGLDPDIALENVGRANVILSSQIPELFERIPQLCAEENYKLVVIDSFTGLFRAEYTGLNQLKERQQEMNELLNQMRRLGTATGTIFAYTNQATSTISTYGGISNAPVGGHIISHASDYRFYVRRKKDDERYIELQDNAGVPEFKKTCRIGWGGFYSDAKTKKNEEARVVDELKKQGKMSAAEVIKEMAKVQAEEEEA